MKLFKTKKSQFNIGLRYCPKVGEIGLGFRLFKQKKSWKIKGPIKFLFTLYLIIFSINLSKIQKGV